jgi:hypothetical protein
MTKKEWYGLLIFIGIVFMLCSGVGLSRMN